MKVAFATLLSPLLLLTWLGGSHCFVLSSSRPNRVAFLAASNDDFQEDSVEPTATSTKNVKEINLQLVQKGHFFDSYLRRFDFGGTWIRSAEEGENVMQYLQAHGLTPDEALQKARRPYSQEFQRLQVTAQGIEFRIIVDNGRRNTTYKPGEWTEEVPTDFDSTIGFQAGSQLSRRTFWKDDRHVTETLNPDGSKESTSRYLKDLRLTVERSFQNVEGDTTSCTETFVRSYAESNDILASSLQRVPGCVANVDIRTILIPSLEKNDYRIELDGQADAMLSRGLLATFSDFVSNLPASTALSLDSNTVADQLGLRQTLSTGRNDGVASMTKVLQSQIRSLLDGGEEEAMSASTPIPSELSHQPTVAVLLSGGVDSSVALNLLKRQGYNITAFYLKIWLEDELAHLGQCPWEDDYRMCEEICTQANVPLESISLQQQYKERVISYTVHEAERGRTPNPDIMCNSRVKFGCFYEAIEDRGFDYVASGHYAQLEVDKESGMKKLVRAPDSVKDQSYFLCALTQAQLEKVLFPIGNLRKDEVRELAQDFDLPNKNRPDSQGLCFLGKVKFDEFLAAYLGERPGAILDATTGEQLGNHRGIWYHTVGQRKGIGKVLYPKVTAKGPWYVVSKDPSNDIVYASNQYDEQIFDAPRTDFFVEDIHWIADKPPAKLINNDGSFTRCNFHIKIRHGPRIVQGSLLLQDTDGQGNVKLESKDGGLAPGQFVVFYDFESEECHGCGVISERHWVQFLLDKTETAVATQ